MNKEIIQQNLLSKFPDIYVEVVGQDSDGFEYDVRCFGVMDSDYEGVSDAVIELNEKLYPDNSICLDAIVFSIEETNTYYPEIALLMERKSAKCCGGADPFVFFDGELMKNIGLTRFSTDFYEDIFADTGVLPPPPPPLSKERWGVSNTTAADESYALAA